MLFLDVKNQLIADEVMNEGTVDHAPVYPREIARRALELSAASVILVHNHPSGDPKPSAPTSPSRARSSPPPRRSASKCTITSSSAAVAWRASRAWDCFNVVVGRLAFDRLHLRRHEGGNDRGNARMTTHRRPFRAMARRAYRAYVLFALTSSTRSTSSIAA